MLEALELLTSSLVIAAVAWFVSLVVAPLLGAGLLARLTLAVIR